MFPNFTNDNSRKFILGYCIRFDYGLVKEFDTSVIFSILKSVLKLIC